MAGLEREPAWGASARTANDIRGALYPCPGGCGAAIAASGSAPCAPTVRLMYSLDVTANPHPLQAALDRATTATFTVVDLIDIARDRKPVSPLGREGRTDARQVSLYRAVIASTVAAIEDTFETFISAGLRYLGTPEPALGRLQTVIGKALQSPNPQNLDNILGDYLGFQPSDHWFAHLACSAPAYSRVRQKDASLDHRNIFTVYAETQEFEKRDLSEVLARFVRIRNSFAHQDVITSIFSKSEQSALRRLCGQKASTVSDSRLVRSISATCAVTLNADASRDEDPLVRWTLHETHAINALLLYLGLVASTCDALASHLSTLTQGGHGGFDRMTLKVQTGRWCDWSRDLDFSTPNVDFDLIPYAPKARDS